jgi:diguanylate cyclase (GGDEF)-like protein/PAS domain S-box-containing protein
VTERPLNVLLIEDSDDDAELLRLELRRAGYEPDVDRVDTRAALEAALEEAEYDVVISDHALPSFSAAEGLALVGQRGLDVPFLIVSGTIGEESAVEAMRTGAHDYIMKSNMARLAPALERELREAEGRRARREAERALGRARKSEAQLAAIVESSDDAIASMSLDGTIVTWNPGAERLYGYRPLQVIGRSMSILAPAERQDELPDLMESVLLGEHVVPVETVRVARDGREIDVALTLSPIRDPEGEITGVSMIGRDVSERKRFERQLRHLAEHDGLTGLVNRSRFEEELARQVAYTARFGTTGVVMVLDLDNFKYVNDSLGHAAGDELIRAVARALGERLRETDLVARLGGDEFGVLLPNAGVEAARRVGEELVAAVREQPFVLSGRPLHVTTSLGAVVFRDERLPADELLSIADLAMYKAKEGGRDRLEMAKAIEQDRVRMEAGLAWGERIRTALEHDLFELYCQPIADLHTGAISRYEVLLRMRGDDGALIKPGAFLPTAERFGQIQAIDRRVVSSAIELLADDERMGHDVCLEVNLSGRSIDDPELPGMIEAKLAATGVAPEKLVIEITETETIANMAQARALAQRLKALGCRFALDDFGAGFSSFYYLKHLPLDYVKIDGDFIRNLARSRTDALVVSAMVEVAQGLGLRTIAEFVEDGETLAMLENMGVDYAQGFHVGRPVPVQQLVAA